MFDYFIEVGFLCFMIVSEFGLDLNIVKCVGLLYDIGKGVEGDYEGSYVLIGVDFVKWYGEMLIVVNVVVVYYEEVKLEMVYVGLVILVDMVLVVCLGVWVELMMSYI